MLPYIFGYLRDAKNGGASGDMYENKGAEKTNVVDLEISMKTMRLACLVDIPFICNGLAMVEGDQFPKEHRAPRKSGIRLGNCPRVRMSLPTYWENRGYSVNGQNRAEQLRDLFNLVHDSLEIFIKVRYTNYSILTVILPPRRGRQKCPQTITSLLM